MGLKEILNEINEDAENQSNTILNQAKVSATKLLMAKTNDLEVIYERKREVLEKELTRLNKKLQSKAELEAQRKLYHIESQLVNSVLEEAFDDLIAALKQDDKMNVDFITQLIKKTQKFLKCKDLEIRLNIEDADIFENIKNMIDGNITLGEPAKIQGGVICVSGRNYIDSSVETLFKRKKPVFVQWIVSELRGEK